VGVERRDEWISEDPIYPLDPRCLRM